MKTISRGRAALTLTLLAAVLVSMANMANAGPETTPSVRVTQQMLGSGDGAEVDLLLDFGQPTNVGFFLGTGPGITIFQFSLIRADCTVDCSTELFKSADVGEFNQFWAQFSIPIAGDGKDVARLSIANFASHLQVLTFGAIGNPDQ